ncbi:hypothetical protein O5343_27505, partial [Escherichia coli]|nr:hypothetical protein [Escherichia coli]
SQPPTTAPTIPRIQVRKNQTPAAPELGHIFINLFAGEDVDRFHNGNRLIDWCQSRGEAVIASRGRLCVGVSGGVSL